MVFGPGWLPDVMLGNRTAGRQPGRAWIAGGFARYVHSPFDTPGNLAHHRGVIRGGSRTQSKDLVRRRCEFPRLFRT